VRQSQNVVTIDKKQVSASRVNLQSAIELLFHLMTTSRIRLAKAVTPRRSVWPIHKYLQSDPHALPLDGGGTILGSAGDADNAGGPLVR
jgi:hypothetical protein